MKKIMSLFAVLGLMVAVSAQADENYVMGGFEASGHLVTGTGYQTVSKTPAGGAVVNDYSGTLPGVIGAYVNNNAAGTAGARTKKDHDFIFFVDEAELDLSKTFGENVRLRTDLDFGSTGTYSRNGLNGVQVEQAYATANLPLGNGLEVLMGRFNTPIGFEAVDSSDNSTISHSGIFRERMHPINSTGLKFYYPFSDALDLHFYVVNDLTDDNGGAAAGLSDSPQPSAGLRFGFSWGDEGSKSTVGVSAAAGNENPVGTAGKKLTYLGDLDFNVFVTDTFAVGGEALYRLDGGATGAVNGKQMAGLLNAKYNFSDVWDGTLKYAFIDDVNGLALTSTANQKSHEISLATGYSVADGATFKVEANYTMTKVDGGVGDFAGYGAAGAFSYNF